MKLLTVPVSKDAIERLDLDACFDGDLIEVALSEEEFNELWGTGIFNVLNDQLSVMIDDFEDESISNDKLSDAWVLVKAKLEGMPDCAPLKRLLSQIENAQRFNTEIYFYF
ncbi:hypothetical protein [Permianibacter aggregans]|uniref:Uncharacterized protein n=1 Tax=Permianibacter aggregans TaxID=1510150 RepID=A0A4R6UYX6_9GAMM|nr:hypothetical protein [Permianibacter aggregans]TDQ51319.1 hypothetical protein EV696_101293 [Permianibacter aggregans]